jgi:predicted  nucleic acid-binding Zn-ribbon protein
VTDPKCKSQLFLYHESPSLSGCIVNNAKTQRMMRQLNISENKSGSFSFNVVNNSSPDGSRSVSFTQHSTQLAQNATAPAKAASPTPRSQQSTATRRGATPSPAGAATGSNAGNAAAAPSSTQPPTSTANAPTGNTTSNPANNTSNLTPEERAALAGERTLSQKTAILLSRCGAPAGASKEILERLKLNQSNYGAALPAYQDIANSSSDSKFKNCVNKALGDAAGATNTNNDQQSCKDSSKEFSNLVSEMVKSCSKANMGSGQAACLAQAVKCRSCDPNSEEDPGSDSDRKECESDDVGTVEAYGGAINNILMGGRTTPVTPDMQKSMKRFRQCPALAAEGYKDMKKDAEDSKDKVEDLTKQIAELKETINDLANKKQTAEAEVQEKLDGLEREIKDKTKEVGDREKEIKGKSQELAVQIADQINVAEEELQNLDITLFDAKIEYDKKVAEASSQCHSAALEKMNRLNAEKQQLIQASLYSAGGFNQLMNSTGLSSREKYRSLTDKFYRECKNDRAFKENMGLLKKTLDSERGKIIQRKNAIKTRVAQLKRNLDMAQKQLPQELQSLFQELQNFKEEVEKRYTNVQQELVRLKEKFAKDEALLNEKMAQLQRQMQEEQSRLQQKQAYLALQHQYSGGRGSDEGAAADAVGAANNVITQATRVIESCGCNENPGQAECKNACESIKSYYGEGPGLYEQNNCEQIKKAPLGRSNQAS